MTLILSNNTKKRIDSVRIQKSQADLMLRIIVEGGGCSGFQYQLDWDQEKKAEDLSIEDYVLIDEMSLSFLTGSTVDFVTGLMGEDFKIMNPNAVSSCGCGTSFSV